uniref:Uncharacterized protein n=1 Tax=Anguilla anguilla TaxID=7936 RepID=A0A0E9QID6_ANGAN
MMSHMFVSLLYNADLAYAFHAQTPAQKIKEQINLIDKISGYVDFVGTFVKMNKKKKENHNSYFSFTCMHK